MFSIFLDIYGKTLVETCNINNFMCAPCAVVVILWKRVIATINFTKHTVVWYKLSLWHFNEYHY